MNLSLIKKKLIEKIQSTEDESVINELLDILLQKNDSRVEERKVIYHKRGDDAGLKKEIDTYISMLTPVQKESVITLIRSFLKTDERISREQYNSELTAAEKRISKGKFVSQKDVERLARKW